MFKRLLSRFTGAGGAAGGARHGGARGGSAGAGGTGSTGARIGATIERFLRRRR